MSTLCGSYATSKLVLIALDGGYEVNNKLYVGNISYQTDENSLEQAFGQFGSVKSVRVITDRETGRSRGFGFVEMETEEEAQTAIENLDGKEVDGRAVRVNIARERSSGRNESSRSRF